MTAERDAHTGAAMTTDDRPSGTQIRDAITWLAWWHTDGAHPDAADRTGHVKHILGQRAYDIIATTADDWYQRNTPGGAR